MKLPKVVEVRQHFETYGVQDIGGKVRFELQRSGIAERIRPGMRVAVAAGSRGISNIAEIIRCTVSFLKDSGASPFIFPAMGSHGGATAEGQIEVLESLGVTEAYCGAPILSSMETVHIGDTAKGVPVYTDRLAWEADGIVIVARIKKHTDFTSPIESGIMKMAAIGMGKHDQALTLHRRGVVGIRDDMPEVARVVLGKAKVLCGMGIIENACEQTADIAAIPAGEIEAREKELLKESVRLMPKLPFEELDVLHVDEIGKNYSGTGMDTNIVGRIYIEGVEDPPAPRIKKIIAGGLSEESHGNATGVGLADLTTRRLFDRIDFRTMNENVITSTFLLRAKIPIVMDHDRAAMHTALRCCWGVKPEEARIVRIPNTLHLERLYISEALLPEARRMKHIEIAGEPEEMDFDERGYFRPWCH